MEICRYIDKKVIDGQMHYILLDEVQLLEDFEGVLNRYMRRQNIDIYVTGSNSKFLSSDVITEFRGRKDEVHIMHLHSPNTFPTMTHLFQRPGTNTAFMAECLIF